MTICYPELMSLKEELQTDWIQTFPTSPGSYTVVLTSGQNLKDYKFGNKYEPKVGCVQPPSGMVAWWHLDFHQEMPAKILPDLTTSV